jgi:16S rRNA C967 or C1407 C5-methylase (RsmB/RsmF family)
VLQQQQERHQQGGTQPLEVQEGVTACVPGRVTSTEPPQAPAPAGFEPESFDAVLLDAPCSGLGLRPRLTQSATLAYLRQVGWGCCISGTSLKWRGYSSSGLCLSAALVIKFAGGSIKLARLLAGQFGTFNNHCCSLPPLPSCLQCGVYTRKFLDAAVKLVRPGGRLVFSTCTLNPCESTHNACAFVSLSCIDIQSVCIQVVAEALSGSTLHLTRETAALCHCRGE